MASLTYRGVLLAALLCASPLHAQLRPTLAAAADTNDWESYFNLGVELLNDEPARAENAFLWASRLDPTRSEALFARWVAYWTRDRNRFAKYLRYDPAVLRSADVQRVDSLRAHAIRRNPFVHQGLIMVAFDDPRALWREDILTSAWLAYGRGNLAEAIDRFGKAISRDPKRNAEVRFLRAGAFVNAGIQDSALAELTLLLRELRSREKGDAISMYESRELIEFAVGMIHASRRENAQAEEAFGRALVENAGYAQPHLALARLADAAKDATRALSEFALAVELDPGDMAARLAYANALFYARRPQDGIAQVQEVIRREPLYAESYAVLGRLHDSLDDTAGAREAYRRFMQLAPRNAPAMVRIRSRLRELGG